MKPEILSYNAKEYFRARRRSLRACSGRAGAAAPGAGAGCGAAQDAARRAFRASAKVSLAASIFIQPQRSGI